MFKLIFYLTLLYNLLYNVNGYTLDEYKKFILNISTQTKYQADFELNIQKLLKQEPNYFNYTPFNDEYKFECDTKDFVSSEVPKSVHQLRPGDINVC